MRLLLTGRIDSITAGFVRVRAPPLQPDPTPYCKTLLNAMADRIDALLPEVRVTAVENDSVPRTTIPSDALSDSEVFRQIESSSIDMIMRNLGIKTGVPPFRTYEEGLSPREAECMQLLKKLLSYGGHKYADGEWWGDFINVGMLGAVAQTVLLNGTNDPDTRASVEYDLLKMLVANNDAQHEFHKLYAALEKVEAEALQKSSRNKKTLASIKRMIVALDMAETQRRRDMATKLPAWSITQVEALQDTARIKQMTLSALAELLINLTMRPEFKFMDHPQWPDRFEKLDEYITSKPVYRKLYSLNIPRPDFQRILDL